MTAINKKEIIQTFKAVYDEEGFDGFERLFKILTEDHRDAKAVDLALRLLYKIDTCISDCFEDLDNKAFCECKCNDEYQCFQFVNENIIGKS